MSTKRVLRALLLGALGVMGCQKSAPAPTVSSAPPAPVAVAPAQKVAAPAAAAGGEEMQHPGKAATKEELATLPKSFDKMPAMGTKALCPVANEVFTVTPKTVSSTHNGKTYVFCCADCKPDFDKTPEKFTQK